MVEEFGVYSVEVNYCKKIGVKDRAQKANDLLKKDKSYEQILVERKRFHQLQVKHLSHDKQYPG